MGQRRPVIPIWVDGSMEPRLSLEWAVQKEKLVFQKYENKHLGNVTVCIVSVNLSPLSLGQINLDPILEYFQF